MFAKIDTTDMWETLRLQQHQRLLQNTNCVSIISYLIIFHGNGYHQFNLKLIKHTILFYTHFKKV